LGRLQRNLRWRRKSGMILMSIIQKENWFYKSWRWRRCQWRNQLNNLVILKCTIHEFKDKQAKIHNFFRKLKVRFTLNLDKFFLESHYYMFKKKIPFRFVQSHFCFSQAINSFPLELKGNRDVFQL
jgi:hypothetical protein